MIVNEQKRVNDKTIVIDDRMLLLLRKKRTFHHQTCLLSVMAAFTLGLAMGIFFLPLIGLTSAKSDTVSHLTNSNGSVPLQSNAKFSKLHKYDFKSAHSNSINNNNNNKPNELQHPSTNKKNSTQQQFNKNNNNNNNFINPNIYSSVSFISDEKYSTENILNSLNNRKANNDNDYGIVAGNDEDDAMMVEEDESWQYNNNNNNKMNKNNNHNQRNVNMNNDFEDNVGGIALQQSNSNNIPNAKQQLKEDNQKSYEKENNETLRRIIENDIYWGQTVEDRLPIGFNKRDTEDWQQYLNGAEIVKIEQGCGRMQNRLVTFRDGAKACVRYRQNTDQIQGELFSFYLGWLLNITNLAPSTATLIDWDSKLWGQVKQHITESQWKTARPVVLTKWIPDLEPSGIPVVFQPLERHLNKDDIRNITMDDGSIKLTQILIDRLKPKHTNNHVNEKKLWQKKKIVLNDEMFTKFIELAQWSDLIIFDYLIANLDRVVNNLYNFQWNADIMAAPAHNLAKQTATQLLVFLDNESGLLHGYRLLKKYEAYHGLLLDNLCIFRKSTIEALRTLRNNDPAYKINEIFEKTTTHQIRDVLPPLPEKSTKILNDRIDRVLEQVQKCQDFYSNR